MKKVSRDELAGAVARVLFIKIDSLLTQKLFAQLGSSPDWETVHFFTRQAVRSPEAARTLSVFFKEQLAVIDAALLPQMYLGGASPCIADIACYVALHAAFTSFDDDHKWALCNASRWFDMLQHTIDLLSPPAELILAEVPFVLDAPETTRPL